MNRSEVLDPQEVATEHTHSHAVRKCVLMGDAPISGKKFDHRKRWTEEYLQLFAASIRHWPTLLQLARQSRLLGSSDSARWPPNVQAFNAFKPDAKNKVARFIFSHSALREGWDNPNVFTIGMLKPADYDLQNKHEALSKATSKDA